MSAQANPSADTERLDLTEHHAKDFHNQALQLRDKWHSSDDQAGGLQKRQLDVDLHEK